MPTVQALVQKYAERTVFGVRPGIYHQPPAEMKSQKDQYIWNVSDFQRWAKSAATHGDTCTIITQLGINIKIR